jgi:type II secretory pathway pseudopilin PulG
MKKKRVAFTLLEIMIALSLSCVVVFGMLQAYRNLMTYLDKVRDILAANRQICLLFNQMERDFNTAYIPPLYKEVTKEGGGMAKEDISKEKLAEKKPLSKEEQEKEKQKELEKLKNYFLASYDEQNVRRHEGRSVYPFKNVAMVNTNPLQVYGQRRVRLVRVVYELKLDKEKSRGGVQSYQLWRKETTDIDNVKMKIEEFAAPTEKEKANPIRMHLVADNIKNLYVEYVLKVKKEEKEGEKKEKGEEEEKRFFSWGDRKETMAVVPTHVDVFIEFWNAQQSQSHSFRASFVIFSYPTMREEEKKDKDKAGTDGKNGKKGEIKSAQVPTQPTPPMSASVTPQTAPGEPAMAAGVLPGL